MTPGAGCGAAPGRCQARPTAGGEAAGTARARGWGRCGDAGGRQEAQRRPRRPEVGGDRAGRGATEKRGGGGDGARAQPTPRARRRPDNKQPRAGRCRSRCLRPRAAQPGSLGLSPPPSSRPARPPSSPRLSIADPIGPPRGNGVSRRARAGAGGCGRGPSKGRGLFYRPPSGASRPPRGEGGGAGLPGPPAQLRKDSGWAAPARRPPPTPPRRRTGSRRLRRERLGGSPGHWEGEARVSVRARPAPPGLASATCGLLSGPLGVMGRPLPIAQVRP